MSTESATPAVLLVRQEDADHPKLERVRRAVEVRPGDLVAQVDDFDKVLVQSGAAQQVNGVVAQAPLVGDGQTQSSRGAQRKMPCELGVLSVRIRVL